MSGERERTIKLYCPSLSKIVYFVAPEEQRLDVGSIARAFGLDPATVKLNGHFIGRGADLVASSVTWKSLLSFFSSRGFSTGTTDSDAIVVDGKLLKVGTKRGHEEVDVDAGVPETTMKRQTNIVYKKPQHEDNNLSMRKKLREGNSGHECGACEFTKGDEFGYFGSKRKHRLEDISPLKRSRGTETHSGLRESEKDLAILNTKLSCSYIGEHVKRTREDEKVVTAQSKRTRCFYA